MLDQTVHNLSHPFNHRLAGLTGLLGLMLTACTADESGASADDQVDDLDSAFAELEEAREDSPLPEAANVTRIQLSAEEVALLSDQNGHAVDGTPVGGEVVFFEPLTNEQVDEFRNELLGLYDTIAAPPDPQKACSGKYLKNVAWQGNTFIFPNKPLGASVGYGPLPLYLEINTSVSAQYYANIGIDAKVVSAGVGYSLTASYGVSNATTWSPPSGKLGAIQAFAIHAKHTWDVWNDPCLGNDTYVGSGRSYRPLGVYFEKSVK